MERRDAIFLLLIAGGGGYAAYANWETIATTLDLRDLEPGRIKAIELAKKASNFAYGVTNWQELQSREQRGEIEFEPNPWDADPIGGEEFRVTVRWTEDEAPVVHAFKVDIARRSVQHEGRVKQQPASPR